MHDYARIWLIQLHQILVLSNNLIKLSENLALLVLNIDIGIIMEFELSRLKNLGFQKTKRI